MLLDTLLKELHLVVPQKRILLKKSIQFLESSWSHENFGSLAKFSVNNIIFKYKVQRDTTDTSYIQYNTFERDTEISLRLV